MAQIAIIGAGVAGLTAALSLKRRGHEVTLFEASDRAGGVIRSTRQGGFLADFGPNSMLAPPPLVGVMLRELDLERQRVDCAPAAMRRYVVRRGRAVAVPTSAGAFLTTPLFSARAKLRVLFDPFSRIRPPAGEESLAGLVRRRLGQELVDYGLNPMIAGIYAGDPERLSSAHAVTTLSALETRYGSLIGGMAKMMRERRREMGKPEGKLFTFRDGMQSVPDAMTRALGRTILYRTRVERLSPTSEGWLLHATGPAGAIVRTYDSVVCAVPSHAAAQIDFRGEQGEDWKALGEIQYNPVAVVVSGYARDAVRHPLDGFGVLVPGVERLNTLGTLFSSSLFAERAPAGFITLTTFVGGARQPELALGGESQITAAVQRDLVQFLGVQAEPVFRITQVWPRAIPQYNLGYGSYKERMDRIERSNPGLYLAGSYRNGVAVGEVMTSGALAADAAGVVSVPALAGRAG